VPGLAFVNLTGTGSQGELVRYIVPLLIGSLAGLFVSASLAATKRGEMATEEERATLQLIIDSISDSIMVMNTDHEIVLTNRAAKVSFNPDFIKDSNHPKCYESSNHTSVPCSGNEYPCPLQEVIKKGTVATCLHKHRHADGTPKYVELKASPLWSEDGTLCGVIEVARDITQHITLQDELREKNISFDNLAHYDQLTQLPNRLLLHDRLRQALKVAERKKQSLGLLLLDMDNFKNVNDSLGHEVGDLLLIQVAERVLKCVRESDTVARLGGDEFVVLLPDCQDADNVTEVTRKVLGELSASFDLQGNEVFVSASIGIALYPDDGDTIDTLLKNADTAMYHIKNVDKNNFQFFTTSMQEHITNRLQLTTQLRQAVQKEEFVLHYQPRMDISTGRVQGYGGTGSLAASR